MNKCLSFMHLIAIHFLSLGVLFAETEPPQARIVSLTIDPSQAVVLHLRPGFVSSVRLLDDVSSVVLGDPGAFKAEHSDAEPRLVFFKATAFNAARTNALITTKSGHEVALSLVSQGQSDRTDPVDYVLTCERPRSFLIAPSESSRFLLADSKPLAMNSSFPPNDIPQHESPEHELLRRRVRNPHWRGKTLQIAVGEPVEHSQEMVVPFAVRNSSKNTIELLPPQFELTSRSKDKHQKAIKAEPVPIKEYWMNTRKLAPGMRADGIVLFERPSFKESREALMLSLSQADAVDHPVLVPVTFVAPVSGGTHESSECSPR